ncbi:MAG: thioesterase family protein [Acidobacteriota bacterium]
MISGLVSGIISPVKNDFRFHHTLRVRFSETDKQGIVFNANYMVYYDVAQAEYFRAIGMKFDDLIRIGADTVLTRMTLDFKSTATFDDLLEIYSRVSKIGNTSFIMDFEIYPQDEDRLISSATAVYVCVDPETLKAARVPDELRSAMGRFEGKDFNAVS